MRSLKIEKKLATSGSLEEMKKLIAQFYYSTPDRITYVEHETHWKVKNGEKEVTPVVVRQGKRFVFGVAAQSFKGTFSGLMSGGDNGESAWWKDAERTLSYTAPEARASTIRRIASTYRWSAPSTLVTQLLKRQAGLGKWKS